jgi:hypothetical protein
MAIELPDDFLEFLRLLNDHNVEYLLIGGYAVSYHGYPRATGDMDIWIPCNPSTLPQSSGHPTNGAASAPARGHHSH